MSLQPKWYQGEGCNRQFYVPQPSTFENWPPNLSLAEALADIAKVTGRYVCARVAEGGLLNDICCPEYCPLAFGQKRYLRLRGKGLTVLEILAEKEKFLNKNQAEINRLARCRDQILARNSLLLEAMSKGADPDEAAPFADFMLK